MPTQPRSTSKSERWPCHICLKTLSRKGDLERHIRTHTGEKPFVCDVCDKGFAQSSALKTHMNCHTGAKPHACQHCPRVFSDRSSCSRHELEVHRMDGCGYQCPDKECKGNQLIKRKKTFADHLHSKHGRKYASQPIEDFLVGEIKSAPRRYSTSRRRAVAVTPNIVKVEAPTFDLVPTPSSADMVPNLRTPYDAPSDLTVEPYFHEPAIDFSGLFTLDDEPSPGSSGFYSSDASPMLSATGFNNAYLSPMSASPYGSLSPSPAPPESGLSFYEEIRHAALIPHDPSYDHGVPSAFVPAMMSMPNALLSSGYFNAPMFG